MVEKEDYTLPCSYRIEDIDGMTCTASWAEGRLFECYVKNMWAFNNLKFKCDVRHEIDREYYGY